MTSDNLLIEFGEDHWPHIALHVGDEGRIGAWRPQVSPGG